MRETEVARAILHKTGAMGVVLKQENSERWYRLEQILTRNTFDPREVQELNLSCHHYIYSCISDHLVEL
jgi:hypothetical protein